jgi:hypothetical protein
MKSNAKAFAYPPPPPPPPTPTAAPKAGRKMRTGIIAGVLIAIIVVAVVLMFFLNIIPWPFGSGGAGGTGTTNYGVVMGKVTGTSGLPMPNVTVSVGSQTAATNDQGWFSIANVTPGSSLLMTFRKDGFATNYRVSNVSTGSSVFAEVTLSEVDIQGNLNAANGGTVSAQDGGSVEIGSNSLVNSQGQPFTGLAEVSITTFDPSDETEARAFPGEYLGMSAQNQLAPLKSFGFMDISITTQNGQKLQLASSQNATISIPVPYAMQDDAANLDTCPLWYFDTNTGTWREEGSGTYDPASGCFIGQISHLSTWNFDILYPAAYISGRVVDSNGTPVQGAQVSCWGTGWYQQRWASGETYTTVNGTFKRIPVEVGVVFKYQASKGGHKSTVLQAGPLNQGQEYDVGDIVLDAPLIQITLTWGKDPRDLDSHLAARLTGNVTFHVYYGNDGTLASEPYANLDTDDTDSYGPEVVSISRLRQGTYRYSVRHYAGEGNITTSGAEINVVIPGVGIYRYTPPATQPAGTDIWRVFDIVIDSNGRVTAVNTINDYVTGGDSSDLLYPP